MCDVILPGVALQPDLFAQGFGEEQALAFMPQFALEEMCKKCLQLADVGESIYAQKKVNKDVRHP